MSAYSRPLVTCSSGFSPEQGSGDQDQLGQLAREEGR